MKSTAADILIDTIYDWGMQVVFGLPGDGINGIMEALRKRSDKIRFVQVPLEAALARHSGTTAEWNLRTKAGEACGNPQAGRRSAQARHCDGVGSNLSAGGDADSAEAVGPKCELCLMLIAFVAA